MLTISALGNALTKLTSAARHLLFRRRGRRRLRVGQRARAFALSDFSDSFLASAARSPMASNARAFRFRSASSAANTARQLACSGTPTSLRGSSSQTTDHRRGRKYHAFPSSVVRRPSHRPRQQARPLSLRGSVAARRGCSIHCAHGPLGRSAAVGVSAVEDAQPARSPRATRSKTCASFRKLDIPLAQVGIEHWQDIRGSYESRNSGGLTLTI